VKYFVPFIPLNLFRKPCSSTTKRKEITMRGHLLTASVLVLMLILSAASAEAVLNLNYQARLTSPATGEPVPDAVYPIEFRLYADSIGGTAVWFDNYDLPTNNGFFNAKLGGPAGLNLDNFSGPLYLEVLVNDELMIPRSPLNHVPYSAIAQRVSGDIRTGVGFLEVLESSDDDEPAIKMIADDISGIRGLILFDPQPEPPGYAALVELSATPDEASLEMTAPQTGGMNTDIINPKFRAQVSSNGGRISLDDEAAQYMGVEPSPFMPGGLLMMIDPSVTDTTIKLLSQGEIIINNNTDNLESRLSAGNLIIQGKPGGPLAPPPIYLNADALSAKIGIGTSNPTTNLHVVGNVRIVDGQQGVGKVLTSDNYGIASWQSPTLLAGEQIQDLLETIDQLNAKVSALENRINELEQSK